MRSNLFSEFHHVSITDAVPAEQPALVIQKLQQCQKIFDFYDPVAQLKSKEVGFYCDFTCIAKRIILGSCLQKCLFKYFY